MFERIAESRWTCSDVCGDPAHSALERLRDTLPQATPIQPRRRIMRIHAVAVSTFCDVRRCAKINWKHRTFLPPKPQTCPLVKSKDGPKATSFDLVLACAWQRPVSVPPHSQTSIKYPNTPFSSRIRGQGVENATEQINHTYAWPD